MKSIEEGMARLPTGVGVLFFAEGTRSADSRLGRFKKGGFEAAIQTGLPILPVTVNGSSKALPKGALVYSSALIEVVVGDPIRVIDYSMERLDELVEVTREVIKSNLSLK